MAVREDGQIMKKINKKWVIAILLVAITIISSVIWPNKAASTEKVQETTKDKVDVTNEQIGPVLSHKQEVWRYTLEWCESRGDKEAINKVDLDGTPSYYSFQFKPGTFKTYGEKYGVIEKGLSDSQIMELLKSYDLQKTIVGYMILDNTVNWYVQFPDCIRKYGLPPR